MNGTTISELEDGKRSTSVDLPLNQGTEKRPYLLFVPSIKKQWHHFIQAMLDYDGIEQFDIYTDHRHWNVAWPEFEARSKNYEFSVIHAQDWFMDHRGLYRLLQEIKSDEKLYFVGVSGVVVDSDGLTPRKNASRKFKCGGVHEGFCDDGFRYTETENISIRRNAIHEVCPKEYRLDYFEHLPEDNLGYQWWRDTAWALKRGYRVKVVPVHVWPAFNTGQGFDAGSFLQATTSGLLKMNLWDPEEGKLA